MMQKSTTRSSGNAVRARATRAGKVEVNFGVAGPQAILLPTRVPNKVICVLGPARRWER